MHVLRRRARHDCLPGRQTLFNQLGHVMHGCGVSHNRSFVTGLQQMYFPQIDSRISKQSDRMRRHQHLPSRLAIHPCHETGKAGDQCVVETEFRLLEKQGATLLRECPE